VECTSSALQLGKIKLNAVATIMPHIKSIQLVVVLVDRGRAEGSSASILLDSRLAPSSEWHEVRERGTVVVVRVPERVVTEGGGAASDGRPLAVAGVDADADTLLHTLVRHLLNEVHVVGLGRGPVLSALDIDPEHTILGADLTVRTVSTSCKNTVTGKVADSIIHLLGGVAARVARENISINVRHTTVPCVGDGRRSVGIGVATGAVHTNHCEAVSVTDHAVERA